MSIHSLGVVNVHLSMFKFFILCSNEMLGQARRCLLSINLYSSHPERLDSARVMTIKIFYFIIISLVTSGVEHICIK